MNEPSDPPVWTLHLPEQGMALQAPSNRSLLHTLLSAGVTWPVSCRNGTCRTCIGQLTSGTVHYSVEWPGLLPEEKTSGAVLPCVAHPRSDVLLGPLRDASSE